MEPEKVGENPFEDYERWFEQVPSSIRGDSLWQFETYRKALYLSDLAWHDADPLSLWVRLRRFGDGTSEADTYGSLTSFDAGCN